MSQSRANIGLATAPAVDVRTYTAPRRRVSNKVYQQALETKLAALQQDYAELHTAMFEAAQVHRRLCAPRHVRLGEFDIASEIFAVRHLSGDFFTVTPCEGGAILALGDIRGKGLVAGMWTTHLVGLVSRYAAATSEPEEIVNGINRDICRLTATAGLASLIVGRLETATGRLDYCSAGHPPALLLRTNGELESLSIGGLVLGVTPAAHYLRGSVQFRGGDALLMYSDGVVESENNQEDEFGYARLESELRRVESSCSEAMLFSLLGAVQDFASPRSLVDDMTLVIVRRDSGTVM